MNLYKIIMFFLFFSLGITLCFLFYHVATMVDWELEQKYCKKEAKERINQSDYLIECYANDNADELFDTVIHCSCFYDTDEITKWGFKTESDYFVLDLGEKRR